MKPFKIGQYVRTTYGIGKITDAFIVYSDDGCLWHLSYMTSNPKIEIGVYTKENPYKLWGIIQKNSKIKYERINNSNKKYFDMVYKEKLEKPICYVPVKKGVPRNASLYDNHKFIEVKDNLEDLIRPFDLVEMTIISEDDITTLNRPETLNEVKDIKKRLKEGRKLVSILPYEEYMKRACYK